MLFETLNQIGRETYLLRYVEDNEVYFKKIKLQKEYYYKTIKKDEYTSLIGNINLRKSYKKEGITPYSTYNPIYTYIRDNFWSTNKYNTNVRGFYLDIETRSIDGFPEPHEAKEEIVMIQFYNTVTLKYVLITDKKPYKYEDKDVEIITITDEKERIECFCDYLQKYKPFFCTAWNGLKFDFPYIYNRMKNIGLDTNKLALGGGTTELITKKYGHEIFYDLKATGINYIDLLDVYKKFVLKPRSSYALDNIGEIELKIKKVNHSEYERFDDFYLGNYKTPLNPTEEQLNSKIYKVSKLREKDPNNKKIEKLLKRLADDDFLYYGKRDVEILYKLDELLQLTKIMIMISQKMGILFNDTMGTVKPWSTFISNIAYQENKITPNDDFSNDSSRNEKNKGGFVRETIPGRYEYIISEDVNSMYPLLGIVATNMSPETYVPINELPQDLKTVVEKYFHHENEDDIISLPQNIKDKYTELLNKYNLSGSVTGGIFKKNKIGLLPSLIIDIYQTRKRIKKESLQHKQNAINLRQQGALQSEIQKELDLYNEKDVEQHVLKILMNSVYGALGNKYFNLFNIEISRAITGNGRFFIKNLADNIESTLQKMYKTDSKYVMAGDTDSCYFTIKPFVKRYIEKNGLHEEKDKTQIIDFCNNFVEKIITPVIDKTIKEHSDFLNLFDSSVIGVEREVISERGCFFAKKQYILAVNDNEHVRFNPPDIKMTGIELKKSTIPLFIKERFEKVIPILLYGENKDIVQFIEESKKIMYKTGINKLAKKTSVSSISYTLNDKSIPINSRASIVYNKYIKENNLLDRFELITPGDDIRLLYLKPNNPTLNNVIAFKDERFINLFKDHIDYNTIFEKFFINSLKNMTDPINWNLDLDEGLDDEW